MEDEIQANADTESGELPFKGMPTKMEEDVATTDTDSGQAGYKGLLTKFIRAYENSPLLWDRDHTDYSNRNKRQKALAKLAELLSKIKPGAGVVDVKKKINSLRSNYRKELVKIMESQEAANGDWDEVYKPRPWVFYELTFLGNVVGPHLPLAKQKAEENSETEQERPEYLTERQQQESSSEDSTTVTPIALSAEPLKKKKKVQRTERVRVNQVSQSNDFTAPHCSSSFRSEENLHQATVWANKLNILEPLQRIYAEKAINDILFEAELGNLTRKSVTTRDGDAISETVIVAKKEAEVISRM